MITTQELIELYFKNNLPAGLEQMMTSNKVIVHIAILYNARTNKILSYAVNKKISSYDKVIEKRVTIHAEQELLIKLKHQMKLPKNELRGKIILFSLRINRQGDIGQSRPCCSCSKMLLKHCSFLSEIIYVDETINLCSIKLDDLCRDAKYSGRVRERTLVLQNKNVF